MMHRGLVSTLVLATILADGNAVRAQVTGGILPGGTCEAGLMYHDINRAIEFQNVMKDVTYSTSTIVFRFGITDAATVSMELGGGMGSVDIDDFSYVVGGSVQTRMWSREPTRVTTTIAFTRILSLYRETGSPGGQLTQSADWNVLLERDVRLREQAVTVWGGPAVSFLTATPQAPNVENTWESSQVLGGMVGIRVLVAKHVSLSGQALWISAFEPGVALAYRF